MQTPPEGGTEGSPAQGLEPAGQAGPRPVMVRLPTSPVRVTYVLLALIGLVFAAQFVSEQLLGFDLVLVLAAKENSLIAQGELWRLVTAIFVHGSLLHIGFNVYALYSLGQAIERFYGSLRFSLIFLLAGISGSVASLLLNPHPSLGTSGAVFGLIGAEAVFLYRNRRILGEHSRRALQNVAFIVLVNLLIGLQGGIDNWAHLGGLAGGLTLAWLIGPAWAFTPPAGFGEPPRLTDAHPLVGTRWLAVLALALGLTALTGFAIALRR